MLAIHFDDKRGSSVSPTAGQYPATNSGHDTRIFSASSCCRASSLTLRQTLQYIAQYLVIYFAALLWLVDEISICIARIPSSVSETNAQTRLCTNSEEKMVDKICRDVVTIRIFSDSTLVQF